MPKTHLDVLVDPLDEKGAPEHAHTPAEQEQAEAEQGPSNATKFIHAAQVVSVPVPQKGPPLHMGRDPTRESS